ncbi:(2Fe-2S)-binding protein [Streptomyces sp. NPDC001595]|uniref:(2Fe-2S)-binding protein n=1 Tax=Streptomyces sp. NPDC001532 TaxID=3154520 RepID=UPI003318B361
MVLLLFVDLDPELAALRPLGGFFPLRTGEPRTGEPRTGEPRTREAEPRSRTAAAPGRPPESPPGPPPTLAQVYTGDPAKEPSDLPADPLAFRVRKVAAALHAAEPRVAASIAHLGLAARLWSVALGCAAVYGRLPDLRPELLRWDPDAGAPDDLWLTETRPLPGDAAADPAVLADAVLRGHLEPLDAALRARHRLAPGLLRGNAASALAGAARVLARQARAHGRAEVAARARTLTAGLFADPRLVDTGGFSGTAFRRRSCCLYYRLPGGGVCGDCCFTRPPRSSPRAASG